MKLSLCLKSFIFLIVLSGLVSIHAQSRYKHLPRVKVKREYTSNTEKNEVVPQTPVVFNDPAPTSIQLPAETYPETAVASTDNIVAGPTSYPAETNLPVKTKAVKKPGKQVPTEYFSDLLKNSVKLLHVKNVDKTTANIPLILMIVFYVLGVILIIMALLMLYGIFGPISLTGFLVVLILGILFSVAASVLLTLLKLGVF